MEVYIDIDALRQVLRNHRRVRSKGVRNVKVTADPTRGSLVLSTPNGGEPLAEAPCNAVVGGSLVVDWQAFGALPRIAEDMTIWLTEDTDGRLRMVSGGTDCRLAADSVVE